MVQVLPAPEVLRCYFDEDFEPHLPAMRLRWGSTEKPASDQLWRMPEGVSLHCPPPGCFGISIERLASDAYSVRLLWDRTCLIWLSLSQGQMMESDLSSLLAALGTSLWDLLDQPITPQPTTFPRAA
jgi:hypothetical protein